MRNSAIASILIVIIVVSAGSGYLAGYANERTVTLVSASVGTSTSTITFVSTEVQTMTRTVNAVTTTIWGGPIPIASVETGNVSIGGSPSTIAVNPNASRIYVAGGSNALTVVDAVSHSVVARITLPSDSTGGIALDYKTGTAYASVQGGIAVVNGTSNKVVGEIPTSFWFQQIAFDSSTDTVYGLVGGALVGVDSHSGKVATNVTIGYQWWLPTDVLVNSQLNLIYVIGCVESFACDSGITVVNGTDARLVNETTLGSAYYATATIDENTGTVYVSGDAQLIALDPYGTVIYNHYPDTCGPFYAMADDPVQNQVIMTTQNYNYLLVYNGRFGSLLNMYSLPYVAQYVAFNPATNETYVIFSEGSLLTFKGVASAGYFNDTLIGAGQSCLPV